MTKLMLMYHRWKQAVYHDGRIDFIGSRGFLMRTYGIKESTAKYAVRMFVWWLQNGV